ncbi:hypothetical protein PM082_013666 [Marasmius tenuissimus]|nr:hypothetical protein PM082_013666 [Marasmius tenuissimus]
MAFAEKLLSSALMTHRSRTWHERKTQDLAEMTRRHSHQLQMDSVPAIQSQRKYSLSVDVGHG